MTKRQEFTKAVSDLLDTDDKTVLLLGDIGVHAFRDAFERHPRRCYNLGTCEQAMVGIAAGLALSGFYPIVHSIASFICRRAYEQIHIDFGAQQLGGLFVGVDGYQTLGPTHHCGEAEMLMRCVPGMWHMEPNRLRPIVSLIAAARRDNALAYLGIDAHA